MHAYVFRACFLRLFIYSCAFLLVANLSYADLINGGKFDYSTNEYFTNLSGPDTSHSYGTPSVIGDKLTFGNVNPLKFSSIASGQNSVDLVDGKLDVTIQAHPGIGLCYLNLYEYGVYHSLNLIGGPGTSAGVALSGPTLEILDIQGGIDPGDDLTFHNLTMTISDPTPPPAFAPQPDYKIFQKVPDQIMSGDWQGEMDIDINDLLPAKYKGKLVHKARLVFDNILSTTSEAGTYAYIDKKQVEITSIDVPEPNVLIMLVLGALGLGIWRRKK